MLEAGKSRAEAILKKLNEQTKDNYNNKSSNDKDDHSLNNTAKNSKLVAGYDSDSSDDYRPSGGAQIAPPTFLQENSEVKNSGTLATARKPKKIVPLFQRSKMNPDVQKIKKIKNSITICLFFHIFI